MKTIEENLERIATALESLVTVIPPALAVAGTGATIEPPAKRGRGKAKDKSETPPPAAEPEVEAPKREDVATALAEFVANGPGKEKAKETLGEFGAGSISTLDAEQYGPFIARLAELTRLASSS